jgi:hypothetical protein
VQVGIVTDPELAYEGSWCQSSYTTVMGRLTSPLQEQSNTGYAVRHVDSNHYKTRPETLFKR